MERRKEYMTPCIDVVEINMENMMLAGSGPDTSLKDQNGNSYDNDKPTTGSGSGNGPGAKPFNPWDESDEW